MASRTLSFSVMRMVAGLLLMTTLLILGAVSLAITNHIQNQITEDLLIGERIFKEAFQRREQQLFNSAVVLTSDFGFKQAIASKDTATINSVLENHGARIGADLMSVLSLQGDIVSSTLDQFNITDFENIDTLLETVLSQSGATTLATTDQRLFQLILLTVDTPTPVGIAIVGFEMDNSFVQQIKATTNLDLTIDLSEGSDSNQVISTLDDISLDLVLKNTLDQPGFIEILSPYNSRVVSKLITMDSIAKSSPNLKIYLSENLQELLLEFQWLLIKIALISCLGLFFAWLLGSVFTRRITQPIASMIQTAKRIANGDYQDLPKTSKKIKELHELTTVFSDMQTGISQREIRIQYQASHDSLTGTLNRYSFTDLVVDVIKTARHQQLVGIEIIGFRAISDTFGSSIADACLKLLAQRVAKFQGSVGRLSEEVIMWLPENDTDDDSLIQLREELEKTYSIDETEICLKLSIATVNINGDASDAESVLRLLSVTLQCAHNNSNRLQSYKAGLEDNYLRRLAVLTALENTLSNQGEGLSMNYQPKLNLKTGKIEKLEALIRWNDPVLGFIPPDEFIVIAERAGLVSWITHWVIDQVIHDIVDLQTAKFNLQVAINLSVHDLLDDDLIAMINAKLKNKSLSREVLSFEITESDLMSDPARALQSLRAFVDSGYPLSIDDFGTGYSSLGYLKNMPVSELKIDKSFIMQLHCTPDDQTIVKTIISLAKQFNLAIVAEGIEDAKSLALLKKWGCDWIQGYYISRPMPYNDLVKWLCDNSNGFKDTQCASAS